MAGQGIPLSHLARPEVPGALERMGRGMTDLYEPLLSLLYSQTDPAQQQRFDAQRKQEEAMYLRGLLGDSIPEDLRGAVPDVWRGLGQSAPFLALGPAGGLQSLAPQALVRAAASLLGFSVAGQPVASSPELWAHFTAPTEDR